MINPSIETLKSTIQLESVIGSVIELKNGKGLCPFHADRNPSFSIKGERFRCFACGESGDSIDFIKKYFGLSTAEAIKHLSDNAGVKASRPTPARIAEDKKRKQLVVAFRVWEAERRSEIAEVLRRYHYLRATRTSFTEAELEDLARLQGEVDVLESRYEVLCGRDDESKFRLYKEMSLEQ